MKGSQRIGSWALGVVVTVVVAIAPVIASGLSPVPGTIADASVLASSPVTMTLDTASPDAVFRTHLGTRDVLTAALEGSEGATLRLRVLSSDATTLSTDTSVVAESGASALLATASVDATVAGTYYVNARAADASTEATLTWHVKRHTTVSLSTDRPIVTWGGEATLTAPVVDTAGNGVAGQYVRIERSYDNRRFSYWTQVRTGTNGTMTVRVKPARKTYYRVRYVAPSPDYFPSTYSASVSVTPKVYLSTPVAPSTMVCNKTYTLYGTLKPRQPSGSQLVRLQVFKYEGSSWIVKRTLYSRAYNYSSYSRYRASATLNSPGKWRIRAYVLDGSKYAKTYSFSRYVTVPLQKPARVVATVSDSTVANHQTFYVYAVVKDAYGKVIPGAKVKFATNTSAGTFSTVVTANASGRAQAFMVLSHVAKGEYCRITAIATAGGASARGTTGVTCTGGS